jgi:hypothetical protein
VAEERRGRDRGKTEEERQRERNGKERRKTTEKKGTETTGEKEPLAKGYILDTP